MSRRAMLFLWVGAAAAVLLLGSAVSSGKRVVGGGGNADLALLFLAALGFTAAAFVAGRIVFVAARVRRRARGADRDAGRPAHVRDSTIAPAIPSSAASG